MSNPLSPFMRTEFLIGTESQHILSKSTILMAGCGGVGGGLALTLARMGIGGFVLADPGEFDLPDLNRQWGAYRSTLGRNKAEVYSKLIADINPEASVKTVPQGITKENLGDLIESVDIVVDGLDFSLPLDLRLRFYDQVRALGRWVISSPIVSFGTLTMLSDPKGMPIGPLIQHMLGVAQSTSTLPEGFKNFFSPDHLEATERGMASGTIPSCAISATISAGIQANEIVIVLLNSHKTTWRNPISLPRILITEPLIPACQAVHFRELFPYFESTKSAEQI